MDAQRKHFSRSSFIDLIAKWCDFAEFTRTTIPLNHRDSRSAFSAR
jgi:hypothetical protein